MAIETAIILGSAALSTGASYAVSRLQPLTDVGQLDKVSANLQGEGSPLAWAFGEEARVEGIPIWLRVEHQSTSHGSSASRVHRYKANVAYAWADTGGDPVYRVRQIRAGKRLIYDSDPDITLTSANFTVKRFVIEEEGGEGDVRVMMQITSDDPNVDLSKLLSGKRCQISGFNAPGNNGAFRCIKSLKLLDPDRSRAWFENAAAVECTSGTCGTATLFQDLPSFVNNDLRDINHDPITQAPAMPGDNFHVPDPLMESYELLGNVERFPGVCVSVLERMKLKHYGSSVPDVEGLLATSSSPVTADVVVESILNRVERAVTDLGQPLKIPRDVSDLASIVVRGAEFRTNASPLDMFQTLSVGYNIIMQPRGGTLAFFRRENAPVITVDPSDLGAHPFGADYDADFRRRVERAQAVPSAVEVTYVDPENGYQQGSQRAVRVVGDESNIEQVRLPLTMTGSEALTIAHRLLYMSESVASKPMIHLPSRYMHVRANDRLQFTDRNGKDRNILLDEAVGTADGIIRCSGVDESEHSLQITREADPREGEPPPGVNFPPEMFVHAFECAPLKLADATVPLVYLAIDSEDPQQEPINYEIYQSTDNLNFNLVLAEERGQTPSGYSVSNLPDGPTAVWDETNYVDIELNTPEVPFGNFTRDEVVIGGRGRCVLGNEVFAYRTAAFDPDATGENVWRLSGLLRGLFNTEQWTGSHAGPERFAVIEQDQVFRLPMSPDDVGTRFYWKVVPEDEDPSFAPSVSKVFGGETLRPLAPAYFRWTRTNSGTVYQIGLSISWVPSTRAPVSVIGQKLKPQLEPEEKYQMRILNGNPGVVHETDRPGFNYSQVQQVADGLPGSGPVTMAVSQYSKQLDDFGEEVTVTVG